jgi:uncharacterized membrane protein YozB (DUF420 family)
MPFLKAFGVAAGGSLVVNLIIVNLLRSHVTNPAQPLEILNNSAITLFTLGGVVGATAVYAIMRRFMDAPDRAYIIVAALVLILSFIPDAMIVGETTGTFGGATWPSALLLMFLHVTTALICVWALTRLWGRRLHGQ